MKSVAMNAVACFPFCDGQGAHIHTQAQMRADARSPPGMWAE